MSRFIVILVQQVVGIAKDDRYIAIIAMPQIDATEVA